MGGEKIARKNIWTSGKSCEKSTPPHLLRYQSIRKFWKNTPPPAKKLQTVSFSGVDVSCDWKISHLKSENCIFFQSYFSEFISQQFQCGEYIFFRWKWYIFLLCINFIVTKTCCSEFKVFFTSAVTFSKNTISLLHNT